MFKIILISLITFMVVIITFLILMSFMNVDIKTNSKPIENFFNQGISYTGGGSINNEYGYYIFTSDGSITFNTETNCEVLIVGGGGGGARNDDWEGGGGGGGGGIGYGIISFNQGTYNIKIGSGGEGGGSGGRVDNGKNGGNTIINGGLINETAYGGGGGGWRPGLVGGSGGGGSGHAGNFEGGGPSKGISLTYSDKANIIYYGNKGGYGHNGSGGGGGGGAGSEGLATGNGNYSAGNGGNGMKFSITGSEKYYGGGGGGASGCYGGCNKANGTIPGNGGLGGGGKGGDRNNPTSGEANTGGGGGGSSKSNGANGGSGIVIIKYKNISSNINSFYTDLNNLFTNKKPWGMYFAEDYDGIYLIDKTSNNRNAEVSGNISRPTKQSGNGATSAITFISGGTQSYVTWPSGSIPSQFTILSLTRYNGGSKSRILTSYGGSTNWLHGHWAGQRGVCYYEGWKTHHQTTIGNTDDWLCCISKNGGTTPNNILVDGIGNGNNSGGTGNYNLSINRSGCCEAHERSDWALSCVIIWDSHLDDNEMRLLNKMINIYKFSGKPIIDMINNTNNNNMNTDTGYQETKPLTKNQEFNSNNEKYYYEVKFHSINTSNTNITNITENVRGNLNINQKNISISFRNPFVLKKIMFIANKRNNAPAEWTINGMSKTATSQDYDEIVGKIENACIKFYIDNEVSTDTYTINITNTIGGITQYPLDFYSIILYEGTTPVVQSTAISSITNTNSF